MSTVASCQIAPFSTDFGWMAIVATPTKLERVAFGYPSRAAAVASVGDEYQAEPGDCAEWTWLVERMQDYAAGKIVTFNDVKLDLRHLSPFQAKVVKHCRAIPYGKTRSYGELAALAGSERAARAAGSTMATNRFPIIIPCHRVVAAGGRIGNYGAPGGSKTKQRMLDLEARASNIR